MRATSCCSQASGPVSRRNTGGKRTRSPSRALAILSACSSSQDAAPPFHPCLHSLRSRPRSSERPRGASLCPGPGPAAPPAAHHAPSQVRPSLEERGRESRKRRQQAPCGEISSDIQPPNTVVVDIAPARRFPKVPVVVGLWNAEGDLEKAAASARPQRMWLRRWRRRKNRSAG